ncbi:hypothetical protein NW762_014312 [Fusarium torreyae]|uniref:Zn(2)-C6 fungal-type domain-containing protein n=1 Tax=Fusarium torreyae TaxID=1237075 RepID=A0A9W8V6M8_9HYPO|nr:hypothetical protein NW762_014312 [Fusarium torreyae]
MPLYNFDTGTPAGNLQPNTSRKPSALACTECRQRHVKCDAKSPRCLRCEAQGLRCHYKPSQRGLKKRKLNSQVSSSPGSLLTTSGGGELSLAPRRSEPEQIVWDSVNPHTAVSDTTLSDFQQPADDTDDPWSQQGLEICLLASNRAGDEGAPSEDEKAVEDDTLLINLFYANFFHGHPFLVPRTLYDSQNYPGYLKLVVHLIGCHYSGTMCSETMQGMADDTLKKALEKEECGFFLVQAFLLFAIILHARCIHDKSRTSLSQAVSLALELGMNRKSFSVEKSQGSQVIEESLRRTWWELYIVDAFFAALDRKSSFRCKTVMSDMPLPCEEYLYTGDELLFEPSTLDQFESRVYAKEDMPFSSFAYLIEAAQLLAKVLTIAFEHQLHRDQIQNIDNLLAAWSHHLDIGKAEFVDSTGGVDQMLLQAHLLINYTTMYLHFPRSDLVGLTTVPSGMQTTSDLLPTYSRSMHGIKAVEAAKRFGDIAGLETSALKLSPFTLDGLLFSAMVMLSSCSLRPSRFHDHYQSRLYLSLGLLKTLNPVWALARDVAESVRKTACQVLPQASKASSDASMSLIDSGIDVNPLDDVGMSSLSWMDFPTDTTNASGQDEEDYIS